MASRASRAEALLTPSRVMISSDTAGAVKFTAPQEVVVTVELVALARVVAVVVVLVVVVAVELVELEARKRRKDEGRAAATALFTVRASQPPSPPPAVRRRFCAVAGQVVAVLPASEAAMVWLAKSEVRVPVTCTSARATPRELRHVEMSHRTPWCTVGSAVVSLDLMPTVAAVLRVG